MTLQLESELRLKATMNCRARLLTPLLHLVWIFSLIRPLPCLCMLRVPATQAPGREARHNRDAKEELVLEGQEPRAQQEPEHDPVGECERSLR